MEELHHLRTFLAVALIRRVPDGLVALQRRDQRANVVARDRAFCPQPAVAHQEAFEHHVTRRAVHDARSDPCAQRTSADFERSEMSAEQNRAAAPRECRFQMLLSIEPCQLADALIRAPPADRSFENADAEAAEVPAQDGFALGSCDLRQAQLEIATRD